MGLPVRRVARQNQIGDTLGTHELRTVAVCAVRVQLSTCITRWNVDHGQVSNACHLHVVGCLHEVCAGDGPVGNETRAIPGLDAPGHLDTLGISYDRVRARFRRREDTEIVYRVNCPNTYEFLCAQYRKPIIP